MQNSCKPDSPWECLSCFAPLAYDSGAVSLDDSPELHCCRACWLSMSPAERLDCVRKWRADAKTAAALEKFEALADGALAGWHIPGFLGESDRN